MPEYNKLVRDRIPIIIKANGQVPVWRKLKSNERRQALMEKLLEEVGEFVKSRRKKADELIDILEVVMALASYYGLDLKHLLRLCEVKRKKNGGFDKWIFLESVVDSLEEAKKIKKVSKKNEEEVRRKSLTSLMAEMERIKIVIPPFKQYIAPTNEFSQSQISFLISNRAIKFFGPLSQLLEVSGQTRAGYEEKNNMRLPPDETVCYQIIGQFPDYH